MLGHMFLSFPFFRFSLQVQSPITCFISNYSFIRFLDNHGLVIKIHVQMSSLN